nr:hypothetical protein [uncultured Desulfuromonas sp.]
MKYCVCFVLLLVMTTLTACSPTSFWKERHQRQQQQQTFNEALDLLIEEDRLMLEELAGSQPQTAITVRAQKLLSYLKRLAQQQQQAIDNLHLQQTELHLLQQENQDLKATMEELKQLFIDMELRE